VVLRNTGLYLYFSPNGNGKGGRGEAREADNITFRTFCKRCGLPFKLRLLHPKRNWVVKLGKCFALETG
jgi:hypothetical protein